MRKAEQGFDMATEGGLRALLGPFSLLILIYLVWFLRYLVWPLFGFAEHLFLMLSVSYVAVLALSLVFLKKDAKRAFSEFFSKRSSGVIPVALVFAVIFQAVWLTISLTIGGDLDLLAFPSLRGYEDYAVVSLSSAFILYIVFAVFGAFVEEVAFRGYVQSRIASKFGRVASVALASLLFSLQHIHIFQWDWILHFLQTQFIYVFCFGIFVGYFFFKSGEALWGVCVFHALMNIFNVALPIKVTYSFPFAAQVATIASFAFMILLLRFIPIEETVQ